MLGADSAGRPTVGQTAGLDAEKTSSPGTVAATDRSTSSAPLPLLSGRVKGDVQGLA